jgi:hypothetical protein
MKVLFLPEVRRYFRELENVLFEKEYFGFEESAIQYVRELFFDIEKTLPMRANKIAPPYFSRYGNDMFYATFRKSKTTQWYVFFTKYKEAGETVYLVRYITNNHVNAQYL